MARKVNKQGKRGPLPDPRVAEFAAKMAALSCAIEAVADKFNELIDAIGGHDADGKEGG